MEQACGTGWEPAEGWSELVVVHEVGPEGSEVVGFELDYLADGEPRTLVVPWTIIGCGSAIDPRSCEIGGAD
ncbi:hypothetical protein [Nocardioides sp.]|uniref:hypothetical protein n=1 Tax=Nocardioides sp. TaxID=35761 RepID=UPI00273271E9|nr:hypothetical protein [Nocardioides sp.]MDP3894025.1 hypothetical protein [Nocardioides sp.]